MLQLQLTDVQKATAFKLDGASQLAMLHWTVWGRFSAALKATKSLDGFLQTVNLTDTQWQTEVEGWWHVALASLQSFAVQFTQGPSYKFDYLFDKDSLQRGEQVICSAQKVGLPSGYLNVSLIGTIIIIILFAVFGLLGLFLSKVTRKMQKKSNQNSEMYVSWECDQKLQLHRMAQEGSHWTGWQVDPKSEVPVRPEVKAGKYDPKTKRVSQPPLPSDFATRQVPIPTTDLTKALGLETVSWIQTPDGTGWVPTPLAENPVQNPAQTWMPPSSRQV
jgi:hypothetical protein